MTDYRFTLQKYTPGSKITCPKCHRKRCATRYIDTLGEITFPNDVCICDHANSCGYHYPPKDYFRDNPEVLKELMAKEHGDDIVKYGKNNATAIRTCDVSFSPNAPPLEVASKEQTISFVDSDLVAKTISFYHLNPLFRFLTTKFGDDEVERIFRLYNVGTSRQWNGSTVYWYRDIQGNYRTGKVMGYDSANGHRIKKPYNQVTWAHSLLKLPDFNMKLCRMKVEEAIQTYEDTLRVAVKHKWLKENYAFEIDTYWLKGYISKREDLTNEELAILDATPCEDPAIKSVFLFCCYCNFTHEEAFALTWSNISKNENGRFVISRYIQRLKSLSTFIVPTSVEKYIPERKEDSDLVFHPQNTETKYINDVFRIWTRDSILERRVTFNIYKATFARIYAEKRKELRKKYRNGL